MNAPKKTGFLRQSYAGVIRQRLGRIEREIAYGVRHDAIRQDLARAGFDASLSTFRTSLARARTWWKTKAQVDAFVSGHPALDVLPMPASSVVATVAPRTATPRTAASNIPPQAPPHSNARPIGPKPSTLVPSVTLGATSAPQIAPPDRDKYFKRESVFSKPNK
jgi:hypothetical protein